MKKTLQMTITLSLILGGLSMTADADPATDLETNKWQLIQYFDESGDTKVLLDTSLIDIQLSDGKFSGTAGCNNYFGREFEKETLDFEDIKFSRALERISSKRGRTPVANAKKVARYLDRNTVKIILRYLCSGFVLKN